MHGAVRPVRGEDPGFRQFLRKAYGDASGTGAEIDDDRRVKSADRFQCRLDNELGFRPGDQHVRRDHQRNAPELLGADDVLERLPVFAAFNAPLEGALSLVVEPVLHVDEEPGPVLPESMAEQKLGIEPRYIPPSSPQDNGRHERMHRTLKAETSKPPARSAAEQQPTAPKPA